MPVTAQGLFKLADINMENRRLEKQDEQNQINNQFRLGQERREQQAADLARPTLELQAEQAKNNFQLLKTRQEMETELAAAMTGTAPGEAFNVGWEALGKMKQNPKYAPVVRKFEEELLQHQMTFIESLDKRDPSKKLSTSVFNQTVGKAMGFQVSEIQEDKEGETLSGKAVNPATGKEEDAYVKIPKDGSAPSGIKFMPSGFDPVDKGADKETWAERTVMRNGKATVIERSNLGNERIIGEAPPKSNALQAGDNQIDILAQQVVEGRLDPGMISKRGGLQQSVFAKVEEIRPGFSLIDAQANSKFATNAGNLTSTALINGVTPLYDNLLEAGKKLGNSNIPGVNKIVNWTKEQTGNPEIVAFNNLRDDVIAESERILMGSGVLSDSKYMRALKNVNSAQSYPQLEAAVKQLRTVVASRSESLKNRPYSLEPGKGKAAEADNSAGWSIKRVD